MAANIEIEAKVLISSEDYKKVLKHFKKEIDKEYEQVNYYIDSKNFDLKQQGIGLRIREADGLYTLTLKAPMAEGLLEKDQMITKEQYENLSKNKVFPEGNIKEFIIMLGYKPTSLEILAKLTTHRIEIDDGNVLTKLSLDKNDYNGITDYEIECEGDALENAKKALGCICSAIGIAYKDNPKSKQSRAMETIKKD